MRELEIHQTTIKHDTQIHPKINEKSMQNSCSTSYPKNIENVQKKNKASQKLLAINKKWILTKMKSKLVCPGDFCMLNLINQ